jgi:TPR repeat protein
MDARNNETHQHGIYNNIDYLNEPLNNGEIEELKYFFWSHPNFIHYPDIYSRRNYDLFIKNIICEDDNGNSNDIYYLGAYYQYIKINYGLMKKYYIQAIEKGNVDAVCNLGCYYDFQERNYDLMKKYYLQAIEKGNSQAMYNLGFYYDFQERNYDLAKKYYLQAIEKGNTEAMYKLGYHYGSVERNYDLMKKYYLQAIEKGDDYVLRELNDYYDKNLPNNEDLLKYFDAMARGNFRVKGSFIFWNDEYIEKIADVFCSNINKCYLNINHFKICLSRIVKFINSRILSYKRYYYYNFYHIEQVAIRINKLLYHYKNKPEYKKCINKIFTKYGSQIFTEYLDLYYYEYLKKTFAPGGKGYIKTKKHFELITKQTMQ